jgi:hypothetical protein
LAKKSSETNPGEDGSVEVHDDELVDMGVDGAKAGNGAKIGLLCK